MKALTTYLDHKNRWAAIFGQAPVEATAENKHQIIDMIECDLSPENLTCDGELDYRTIMNKKRLYEDALEQALAL